MAEIQPQNPSSNSCFMVDEIRQLFPSLESIRYSICENYISFLEARKLYSLIFCSAFKNVENFHGCVWSAKKQNDLFHFHVHLKN